MIVAETPWRSCHAIHIPSFFTVLDWHSVVMDSEAVRLPARTVSPQGRGLPLLFLLLRQPGSVDAACQITMICLVLRPSCIDCLFLPSNARKHETGQAFTLVWHHKVQYDKVDFQFVWKKQVTYCSSIPDISCQMALLRAVSCLLCTWFARADLDLDLYKTARSSPNLKAVEASVQKISVTERAR